MNNSSRNAQPFAEIRATRWLNPTSHSQRVILQHADGRQFQVTWEPGETKELPSDFDRAIHMVDCGQDACHQHGWFCTKGHDGLVQGGLAPLLVRVGAKDTLQPDLDPSIAEKRAQEANMAAASLAKSAADQALVIAAAKAAEQTASIAASSANVDKQSPNSKR